MGNIWYCKIGEVDHKLVPAGGDSPMREAIKKAYFELTGEEPKFCFSAWGIKLTETERKVADAG